MNTPKDVVLAFSGGLDTSFCVPWLADKGYNVTTVFVDTGGVDDATRASIADRAAELGTHEHIAHDASGELWRDFVTPLVMGGATWQDQYPLLCSDRYAIAASIARTARELGTNLVAHGCTAMGNDQVRFDQSIRSLGEFEILAPIREIQAMTDAVREFEIDWLAQRGIGVDAKTTRYTINENLLGVTVSGSEIDEFAAPGDETHCLTAPPAAWPSEPLRVDIGFERGVAVSLDGVPTDGPAILATLNERFGAYGVGRGIYTGDTTIGLKGRIVFECPGLTALLNAHRALEEAILTRDQNAFKPLAAKKWVELVYGGFFYEPLRADLEALIRSTQRCVSGTVTLETYGGTCHAVAIDSPHLLRRAGATYAQGADWTAEEAQGFIKLLGQSSITSALVNPVEVLAPETAACSS